MLRIKEVEMVGSLGELKSRDRFLERTFQTLRCWTRRLLLLWIRSSRTPTSRRRSVSRSRKPRKRIGGRQIAFMICDYFRVTGAHDTVLDYADYALSLFITIMFRNSIQDGMKFYFLCQRFSPTMSWTVCTN